MDGGLTSWWWWEAYSWIWIWHKQRSIPRYYWWTPLETQNLSLWPKTSLVPTLPTRPRSPWRGPQRRLLQHLAQKNAVISLWHEHLHCATESFIYSLILRPICLWHWSEIFAHSFAGLHITCLLWWTTFTRLLDSAISNNQRIHYLLNLSP